MNYLNYSSDVLRAIPVISVELEIVRSVVSSGILYYCFLEIK